MHVGGQQRARWGRRRCGLCTGCAPARCQHGRLARQRLERRAEQARADGAAGVASCLRRARRACTSPGRTGARCSRCWPCLRNRPRRRILICFVCCCPRASASCKRRLRRRRFWCCCGAGCGRQPQPAQRDCNGRGRCVASLPARQRQRQQPCSSGRVGLRVAAASTGSCSRRRGQRSCQWRRQVAQVARPCAREDGLTGSGRRGRWRRRRVWRRWRPRRRVRCCCCCCAQPAATGG